MTMLPIYQRMNPELPDRRYPHDKAYHHGAAFCGGQSMPIEQASVPLLDNGFTGSDACYDVISASDGAFFRFDDHMERFEQSCKTFCLENPYSREETQAILTKLLRLTGFKDAFIWFAVTRGLYKEEGRVERNDISKFANQFYAYVVNYVTICTDKQREAGFDIMISKNHIRIPMRSVNQTAKNLHFLDGRMALIESKEQGYDWSLLLDAEGNLTESPGANIFIVKDNHVYTPDTGILLGITRRTTIELCEELGLPVTVAPITADRLLSADEAFLTSTAGGIMPINSVDGQLLGGVKGPGPLSEKLHNLYWQKRDQGWLCTPIDYGIE